MQRCKCSGNPCPCTTAIDLAHLLSGGPRAPRFQLLESVYVVERLWRDVTLVSLLCSLCGCHLPHTPLAWVREHTAGACTASIELNHTSLWCRGRCGACDHRRSTLCIAACKACCPSSMPAGRLLLGSCQPLHGQVAALHGYCSGGLCTARYSLHRLHGRQAHTAAIQYVRYTFPMDETSGLFR